MNTHALPAIGDARLPSTYEAAKTSLAECQQVDECKTWADKAVALASYARQAEDDDLLNMAMRIKARAVRRSGELLKQIESQSGGDRRSNQSMADHTLVSRTDAARNAGMSKHQQMQATRIANIPQGDFEAQVESEVPPTLSQLAQQGVQPRPTPTAPDPQTWLKGRDPKAFNRALHFLGDFQRYAEDLEKENLSEALGALIGEECKELRGYIARINALHNEILERI